MFELKVEAPKVLFDVKTTENRGHTPEEVAELCVNRLISVADDSHPLIQAQARAFREQMFAVVTHYIKMGVEQDRATLCETLRQSGQGSLAEQIRRL